MSGGPLYPSSITFVTSNKVGPGVHVGNAATGLRRTRGIQVIASLDADADVEMTFEMPSSLPSGTPKLRLLGRRVTIGTSGVITIKVDWASVAVGEDPSLMAYLSESPIGITFPSSASEPFVEQKVSLIADTVTANEIICMRLRFLAGSTVAAVTTWEPSHVWE